MQDPTSISTGPGGKPLTPDAIITEAVTGPAPAGDGITATPPDAPTAPAPLSPEGYRTAPDHTNTGWPPGVPYIVGNEACERFSFYGMRAILQVHLVSLFAVQAWIESQQDARRNATQTVHLFMAGVYALPMIGALIADRWAGKFRTILYLSLVYCAGHAALSMFENELWGMYLGLGLIAVGSGGIKPCVSANVGDQFGKMNLFRVRAVYQIFYFSINFGSFFATLLIPFLRSHSGAWLISTFPQAFSGADPLRVGTSIAFGLPGVLMFLATFVFWLGRRKFVHVPPRPGGQVGLLDTCCSVALFLTVGHLFFTREPMGALLEPWAQWLALLAISAGFLALGLYLFAVRQRVAPDDGFLAITLHVLRTHLRGDKSEAAHGAAQVDGPAFTEADAALNRSWFWRPGIERFGRAATEGPVAVFKIVSVFFLVSIFWALFDQHSSTWITQAGEMDLRLWGDNESFLGIPNKKLEASQVPAANPLMVMLLIPLMNLLYNLCDRLGVRTTPLRRVTLGMVVTALSFVATARLQQTIDASPPHSVWIGWQMIQYLIITVGEVMVSITGLEFAYTQAPKKMKSTVMGFWLLTVTLGNVLVAFLAGFKGLSPVNFFWVFAGLSGGAALLFGLRALFYVPKDYAQE